VVRESAGVAAKGVMPVAVGSDGAALEAAAGAGAAAGAWAGARAWVARKAASLGLDIGVETSAGVGGTGRAGSGAGRAEAGDAGGYIVGKPSARRLLGRGLHSFTFQLNLSRV